MSAAPRHNPFLSFLLLSSDNEDSPRPRDPTPRQARSTGHFTVDRDPLTLLAELDAILLGPAADPR